MIVETLRMVHTALLDPDVGLAVQLAALALDKPVGSVVADTRPSLPPIRNAADSDVSVREADETFPILLVDLAAPATAQGEIWSGIRDNDLDVIVAILEQSGNPADNTTSTDYLLRATVKAIAYGLLANEKRSTTGTRNGYVIAKSSRIRYGPAKQDHHGGVIVGAANFTLTVRDTNP